MGGQNQRCRADPDQRRHEIDRGRAVTEKARCGQSDRNAGTAESRAAKLSGAGDCFCRSITFRKSQWDTKTYFHYGTKVGEPQSARSGDQSGAGPARNSTRPISLSRRFASLRSGQSRSLAFAKTFTIRARNSAAGPRENPMNAQSLNHSVVNSLICSR